MHTYIPYTHAIGRARIYSKLKWWNVYAESLHCNCHLPLNKYNRTFGLFGQLIFTKINPRVGASSKKPSSHTHTQADNAKKSICRIKHTAPDENREGEREWITTIEPCICKSCICWKMYRWKWLWDISICTSHINGTKKNNFIGVEHFSTILMCLYFQRFSRQKCWK